jgi:hypothetical protein
MEKTKVIVEKIIDELNGRGGFDGWWGGVDEDIQNEIKEDLCQIIQNTLKQQKDE